MSYVDPWTGQLFGEGGVEKSLQRPPMDNTVTTPGPASHVVHGKVIMPKLGNATAKAALGRATWKLMYEYCRGSLVPYLTFNHKAYYDAQIP
ncbi:hypothetical protein H0H93_011121 [Arthromyces matolae]|nr:hypothetical protein H0H93_011121 [Arthromyces matolae]